MTQTSKTTPPALNGPLASDPLLDHAKLSAEQYAAMQTAEAARDEAQTATSFAGQLFMGRFDFARIAVFPDQTPEERRIGDELVERVRCFLSEHLDPEAVDESRTIPPQVVNGLRAMGVFRMKVPVEYGGLGFSQVNYNRVMQAIASYCASTAVLVSAHQSIGVPQPLKMFGTAEQKARFLPRIARGDLSAFALTEPEVGSDPARMTTWARLTPDGRHYILNGTKLWTTNGPIAQLLVVMAQTPPLIRRGRERRQITAFIVDMDTPGIEVLHRCDFMGLRAIQNGVLKFTDVKVPVDNRLGDEGQGLKIALRTLNTGRLTLPAACVGIGKQCLTFARHWGAEREQWGRAIGRHEAGAYKIASIAATTFAMEAVTSLVSHWADEGRDIRVEAAMAKLFCSEASWQLVDETLQLRGGRGYERASSLRERGEAPYPIERMMRDCRINRIIEGTTDIMHLFIAREALDPHLKVASGLLRTTTWGGRITGAAAAAGRYAAWYLHQSVAQYWHARHAAGGRLATHLRFVDRMAHRLARAEFHAMARYGPKLDRRQALLAHLVEIGTELFVMATVCAYAAHLRRQPDTDADSIADYYCRQARHRVTGHFRDLRRAGRGDASALAGSVLDGEFRWLEQGVIDVTAQGADRTERPLDACA